MKSISDCTNHLPQILPDSLSGIPYEVAGISFKFKEYTREIGTRQFSNKDVYPLFVIGKTPDNGSRFIGIAYRKSEETGESTVYYIDKKDINSYETIAKL